MQEASYSSRGAKHSLNALLTMRVPVCLPSHRATDDDWIADFNCMYTESMNSLFNAPAGYDEIHLHKGFYTAYNVVGEQLEAEIKRQLLLVKVRAWR